MFHHFGRGSENSHRYLARDNNVLVTSKSILATLSVAMAKTANDNNNNNNNNNNNK